MNGLYTTQRYAEGNGTLALFGRNWKANKTFVTIWTEQVFFVSIQKIKQLQHLYKCLIVIFIFALCVLDFFIFVAHGLRVHGFRTRGDFTTKCREAFHQPNERETFIRTYPLTLSTKKQHMKSIIRLFLV